MSRPIASVLVVLLLVSGCQRVPTRRAEPVAQSGAPPAVSHQNTSTASGDASVGDASASLEDLQRRSLAIQSSCGSIASRARAAQARYDSWVDMERGPSCHEHRVSYGTYSLNWYESCDRVVSDLQSGDAVLARPAAELLEVLHRLDRLLGDASAYYRAETYRLDGCAHGRELHPQLVESFADLARIDAELDVVAEDIEDRAIASRLASLAADPTRREDYLIELAMDRGRRLTQLVRDEVDIRRAHLVADDVQAVREAVTAYALAVDDLGAFPASEGSMRVRTRMSVLVQDARALILRLDGEVFDSHDRFLLGSSWPDEVFGSPQRLTAHFNELVQAYNAS